MTRTHHFTQPVHSCALNSIDSSAEPARCCTWRKTMHAAGFSEGKYPTAPVCCSYDSEMNVVWWQAERHLTSQFLKESGPESNF